MRTSIGVALVLSLAGFGVISGCGGDTSSGTSSPQAQCERFASQLRACGLLSDGETGCHEAEDVDCAARCFLRATCSELDQLFCQDQTTGGLAPCLQDCEQQEPEFACGDGDSIPLDWKCDGGADCLDGSDEVGCPPESLFTCADGPVVPADWQCDGLPDCSDASNEVGCPPGSLFVCGDGESIPADWECDSEADCADASDEQGCPERATIVCGSSGADSVASSSGG